MTPRTWSGSAHQNTGADCVQDTAGREIYAQRSHGGGRDERERNGRQAIGMDRIREEGGWLMEEHEATADEPQDMQVASDDEGPQTGSGPLM